ncbi:hypothetical protein [Marinobacterium stanieri]|uniref:Uncharacterized protein n=1 Tax=Marinobacterium stanieri TaxID=49186 RepID=A0A1N6X848_9GAMM|nr:hypothetical protein [Marinobacterium stanieri]SIQ98528.1 hypothetical protein SAMN05421647_11311 [Marinobacterium stanieri]
MAVLWSLHGASVALLQRHGNVLLALMRCYGGDLKVLCFTAMGFCGVMFVWLTNMIYPPMNSPRLRLVLASAGLVLSGCAANTPEPAPVSSNMLYDSDPALQQLVSVAQAVHSRDAIHDSVLTQKYQIEEEQQLSVQALPADMRRIISFPGGQQLPLETVLKHLAQAGGMSYLSPQGIRPLSNIYVFFDDQLRTVGEYVADAGRQAGYRADVVLDLTIDPPSVQIQYKEPRL